MRILAIDTSTSSASAALLQNNEIVAEVFIDLGTNHSATLLPAVENICNMSGVHVGDMDLFVCTLGPGSFTGVRIGVSTVKGFALAAEKPVVGVSTLDTLALNLAGARVLVCPMLDARKNQVYTALYEPDENNMLEKKGEEIVTDIKCFLQSIEEEVVFLGNGAEKYSEIIKESLPGKAYFTVGPQNRIRASMAGILGGIKFCSGERMDPVSLMPKYLRLSEAESRMSESHGR
jgi:tRNA threonylcarbamoyladenosine biosynthesis protein TsaB